MALIYRQTKGSALTIAELDGNFQYFTGSHSVTGSLTVSGSIETTGSISVSGSGLSPLILLNIPQYDSNQEALDAGLTAGMVYRNLDALCIVNND